MLAVVLPALLAWVLLRLRVSKLQKVLILAVAFLMVNAWFKFVIANRSSMTIATAIKTEGLRGAQLEEAHHEGLNMYEELCWINTFLLNGSYRPNWGERYFAEVVNPIPRTLWPGKPEIGIDYAIARGQSAGSGSDDAGVAATISTGMIGQGVVNFGRILGPAGAALLMGLWAAWLARLDLQGEKLGRIPLFALGIALTFNLGRDITLITLYPFVFGALGVWWFERRQSANHPEQYSTGTETSPRTRSDRSRRRRALSKPSPFAVSSIRHVESEGPSKPQS
jgi:hypothetical protein